MMRANGLPDGWYETTLGAIRVDRSTSIDPSKHTTEGFELYSIPAYPSGRPEVVTGSEVGSTKKSLDPGTVVVSKINPRINRVWVVGERKDYRQIGSSEWIPFCPLAGVDPNYLAYFMRQDAFRNYLAANVSGVGGSLMRVKPSTVDPYPFVLAPGPEQHRIVSAIESHFTRLDDAVATLERAQRNLKRYRASLLKAAVEGRLVPTEAELARAERRSYEPASVLLTRILAERRRRWEEAELAKMEAKGKAPKDDEWKAKYAEPAAPDPSELPDLPEGWCWSSLGELFDVRVGATPSRAKPEYWNGGIPWVSSGEVAFCRIASTRETISEAGLRSSSTQLNPAGSVLLGMIGEGRTRGQAAILTIAACSNQNSAAIWVSEAGLPPEYVYYFLMGQYEVTRTRGSGNNQPALNKSRVQRIPIPLPPLAEANRIVRQIEEHGSVIESVEATARMSVDRLTRLRQSILKWAFEGRLVDQDPNDEPASVLLERIRAERTSATDAPPRRTRRSKARVSRQ